MGISDPNMAVAAEIAEELLKPSNAKRPMEVLEEHVNDLSGEVASNVLWILGRHDPEGTWARFEDNALEQISKGSDAKTIIERNIAWLADNRARYDLAGR